MIKRLVTNKFAVILETGYVVAGEGWMGHYLTVVGYDDGQREFHGLDTYLGDDKDNLGIREKYDDLDQRWQQFDRVYIVVYTKDREPELAADLLDEFRGFLQGFAGIPSAAVAAQLVGQRSERLRGQRRRGRRERDAYHYRTSVA